jgi:hypothetical protein
MPDTDMTQRSTFVTVVGWIFTILSGFMTIGMVVENLLVHLLFGSPEFMRAMQNQNRSPDAPPVDEVVVGHAGMFMQVILLVVLLFAVFFLVSSIGLIRRWNWARWCFIVFMALGIVQQLGGLIVMAITFFVARTHAPVDAPDMSALFAIFGTVMGIFFLVMIGLFGWIIKKLVSAPIAAGFGA